MAVFCKFITNVSRIVAEQLQKEEAEELGTFGRSRIYNLE
jgi:hypothetical protein